MISDKNECQYIFKNLLSMFNKEKTMDVTSSLFVRELLQETPRCDEYGSLMDVREAYTRKIADLAGTEVDLLPRILAVKDVTASDERVALAVVNLYNS